MKIFCKFPTVIYNIIINWIIYKIMLLQNPLQKLNPIAFYNNLLHTKCCNLTLRILGELIMGALSIQQWQSPGNINVKTMKTMPWSYNLEYPSSLCVCVCI